MTDPFGRIERKRRGRTQVIKKGWRERSRQQKVELKRRTEEERREEIGSGRRK